MQNAVGAEITRTSARTLYWEVTTDATVAGTPQVAILGLRHTPNAATVWTTAQWDGAETVTGAGTPEEAHTRRLRLLVAGPQGPTVGSPLVVPGTGEYSTWVRVATATDTIEVQGSLLYIR